MASNVSSNPFATVGASWMDEPMDGNDGGKMVLETSEREQPDSAALHNHMRVNSAPTKLVSNDGKKANWGEILGGGSRGKNGNKRKYVSPKKRPASATLNLLDTNMSGLNVLSPKQQLLPDSSVPAVTPISLHDGNDIDLVAKHIAITKPKHKRSKSESSIKKEVAVVLRNGQIVKKILSNRSVSALGKLRGSYKCGKCGVPKKGHVCPHELPKETRDASTQCSFDINPLVNSDEIRMLVTKLQEKGVISLSNANDVFSAMLEKVVIPKEEGSGQLQKQAATGSTSSKTQKPKKARKVKSRTAPKIKKSKQARGTKAKKQSQSPRKKGKKKLRVDRSDLDGPLEPARVNSLRTFDSIDSTVSDDLDLDMDPTDAFEFNLTSDEFQGEKWFGDDIGNSDMPMSVSYSA